MHRIRTRQCGGRRAARHSLTPSEITFVVLTKDEERNIGDCLRSLPVGSNAVVYDARSSDRTVEIARACGARVVSAEWAGFARARTAAAALGATSWTFMLDADERLTPQLVTELLACRPRDETRAYSVARKNYFCGKWIRGAGWWPDRLVRMFRSGAATIAASAGSADSAVHERWLVDGMIEPLSSPLEHFSYPDVAAYKQKFARYTSLEAKSLAGSVGALPALAAWALVPPRAVWLLVARGGLLDGWRGAYVSFGSACYPAVAKWKAWRG